MTSRTFAVLLLLITIFCQPLFASESGVTEKKLGQRIDALIAPWDRVDAPGLAVLVQKEGTDIYRRCVGSADLELGVSIGPEICFDLASVSKHFTAFGVLLLVEEGELSLDDGVRRYLPELPLCAEPVRVRHLLHQSSGLWEFWTILNKYSGFHRRDYIRLRDVLILLQGQPALNFEPGSRYAYTNTNYSLLSLIVERAGGAPFGEWMREHVFEPLGMESTLFQTDCTELISHRATAYLQDDEGYRLARPSNVEVPGSAHAFSNLEDMSRWLANFRHKRLGGNRVFEHLTTPGLLNDGSPTGYAAGLIVGERRGVKTISHSGQTGGYKTMLIYCPDEEIGIMVLANGRSINAGGIAYEILDICLGVEEEDESATASGDETEDGTESFRAHAGLLDRYTGGYRLDGTGQLVGVYRDREWLVAAIHGLGGEYFSARSETEFTDYSGNALISFELDGAGDITGLSLALTNDTLRARRIAVSLDAEDFAREVGGHYYCAPLGSLCEVTEAGGALVLTHRRYDTIELHCIDSDRFFCEWGFIAYERNENGFVTGFELTDELFAWQELRFVKIDD